MKLAISNIAWKPNERKKIYDFLKLEKIEGLEIAPKLFLFKEKNIFDLKKNKINHYLNELRKKNLKLVSMQSLLYEANNCHFFKTKIERDNLINQLKKVIILAGKLGIPNLVFGSPKNRIIPEEINKIKAQKIAISVFKKINSIAKKNNVIFSLESNPKEYGTNFLNTIYQTSVLVKKMKLKNIKMVLDSGEILMNSESKNIKKILKNNINYINHVHLSEPYLKVPKNEKFIKKLIYLLNKYKYKNWVSIEMRSKEKNNFINVFKTIKLVKNIIRSVN
tara:strand:+ start:650 stop:1483 length:834 start_codon:yes stop_codon:yes gene_type:complete